MQKNLLMTNNEINMKNRIVLLGILPVFCSFMYAQNYSQGPNVYTCKGGAIATLVASRELTPQELLNSNYEFFDSNGQYYYLGLKVTDIVNPYTAYYNCHA
jgi:hypothetical protein